MRLYPARIYPVVDRIEPILRKGGGLELSHNHLRRSSFTTCIHVLGFSQKLDLGASASVAKSLFHWLRGRFMMLKRMLRIQFL